MYDVGTRERTLALVAQGRSLNSVSKQTGISRAAIRSWQTRLEPLGMNSCPRCAEAPTAIEDPTSYAYLLGLYLGDGCISSGKRGVYSLRIACADAWPGLIDACAEAIRIARPHNKVCRVASAGCQYVTSFSKHWPCFFPQHGPGKKHDRRIALEPWQQMIVDAHPWGSSAGSSTPTAAASPTGPLAWSRVSASATSTPGTSSPTSPTTSANSSATRSLPSASSGQPWHAAASH